MIGTTLHHYRIVRTLGKGGMGEVYAAEDTRLHREVALKILPHDMASDPERLQRFEREAQAVAALNHPNIVTIYAVEETENVHFIAMELVEGKTLAQSIPKGGLGLQQFMRIAVPLVDAIAAAHQRGIVHRDLKPANIMLTDDGRLKVLDFGLAKLKQGTVAGTDATTLSTGQLTMKHSIIGTPEYMSPEQAEGRQIDHRTDIFSLGVIFYEMATGERPFQGTSVVSILSAIIKDMPPPVLQINPGLPQDLERIIMCCLAKDPAGRYQNALDLRKELNEVPQQVGSGKKIATAARATSPKVRLRIPRLAWTSLVLLAAAGLLIYQWRSREPAQVQAEFKPLTTSGAEQFPSLSPEGEWFIYSGLESGHRHIFLQSVGGQTTFPLTKDSASDNDEPAFSRDGARIAFWSNREGGGIWIMGRTGENAKKVTGAGFNPSWSPDGKKIVYATENVQLTPLNMEINSELYIVDVNTGVFTRLSAGNAVQPCWSPNNLRIAYVARSLANLQLDISTMPVAGGEPTAVTNDVAADWSPVWSPDGKYLYFASTRGGTMNLWRVRIDEASGKPLGKLMPITTPAQSVAHPSISADGKLIAYCSVTEKQNIQRIAFDPVSEKVTGEPQWVTFGLQPWSSPDISPDGQWLAFYSRVQSEGHLYVQRADGTGQLRRLTEDAIDRVPRWSPDGKWIAAFSDRSGSIQLWKIRPDGSGLTQLTSGGSVGVAVWSENGSRIAVSSAALPAGVNERKTYVFDPTRPWNQQTPQVLPTPEASLSPFVAMTWSPDGERLVGQTGYKDRTAAGFVMYSFKTNKYERLTDYGEWPVWLSDGRRLLCVSKGQEFIIIDTQSRKVKKIFPATLTRNSLGPPRLPHDQSYIYFSRRVTESGISLVTLK
jgi:serine/threonine protein kinase/WD40 repeat protein